MFESLPPPPFFFRFLHTLFTRSFQLRLTELHPRFKRGPHHPGAARMDGSRGARGEMGALPEASPTPPQCQGLSRCLPAARAWPYSCAAADGAPRSAETAAQALAEGAHNATVTNDFADNVT